MEDKKQDVNSLEELSKAAYALQKCIVAFGNELSRALDDIKELKKEEETWEMKCPYKIGDEYWCLYSYGGIYSSFWSGTWEDKDRFNSGNIFPNKETAELEAKRRNLLTRFKAFRDECNDGWKPDMTDVTHKKYYLSYSETKVGVYVSYIVLGNHLHIFGYFKNKEDAERAVELFGDEIKELFVEGDA